MTEDNREGLLYGVSRDAWVESSKPCAYRLARQVDGTLVLQGCYVATNTFESKTSWRTIPTVMLEE